MYSVKPLYMSHSETFSFVWTFTALRALCPVVHLLVFLPYPLPTLLPEASTAVAKRTPEPYTGEYVSVSFN